MRRAYSPGSLVGWSIPGALPQAGMSWAFGPLGVESHVPNRPYLTAIRVSRPHQMATATPQINAFRFNQRFPNVVSRKYGKEIG